jgi:phosphoglycolate phosphatase
MELLIFDLDGTLVDSKLDLAHAVNATRANMGMAPLDLATVSLYVGNGAPVLIKRSLGPEATDADVARGLEYFLAWYQDHLLDHTRLYPGVREALDCFRERGIPMAVLTNKPVRSSVSIVEGLELARYFVQVYGGNSFEQKKPHRIGVDTLLEITGARRENTLLVGDSAVDVRTARNAEIRVCGVTYGFQPESFTADPPDLIIDRMDQLPPLVLG